MARATVAGAEANYVEVVMADAQATSTIKPDSDPPRFLHQVLWAVATGFVVLVIFGAYGVGKLCGDAENRSIQFYHRCHSALAELPLLGLVIIVLGFVLARVFKQNWIRGVALVLALVPIPISFSLFNV
jgi:hypothetical protein